MDSQCVAVKTVPLFLLFQIVVEVVARTSPHADLVERRYPLDKYSEDVREIAVLDVPGLIAKHGYPVQVYQVTTDDGYILEMHRIPHGRDNHNKSDERKPAVLVMHGLGSTSVDFLLMGPDKALGYHLAEAGYDVWFGNARGNYYSRRHQILDPDRNKNFWRFSWDEIGNYDLPAFVDFILHTTGQRRIHYVGHSQGGTTFFVLNSLRPEYNDKFISFQGLAPAAYFTYNELQLLKKLVFIGELLLASGIREINPKSEYIGCFLNIYCGKKSLADCLKSRNIDLSYLNMTMLPVILGHVPVSTSTRQWLHYAQVKKSDTFRRYDHGFLTNLQTYGQSTPPAYDLSRVTVPSYIYYGMSDRAVYYKDIYKLVDKLPNVAGLKKMSRDSFGHFDFIWAKDATEQLYKNVVINMKNAEAKLYKGKTFSRFTWTKKLEFNW